MTDYIKSLRDQGLLNEIMPDVSDMSLPTYYFKGICTGEISVLSKHGRYKRVNCRYVTEDKFIDVCPDCGSSLLWKRYRANIL